MGYWEDRQAATQTALTKKGVAQTEKQLSKYYERSLKNVLGQFETTYYKLLSTIKDGREPTPADLYKLDTYWKMQAELTKELRDLGNLQAVALSESFTEQYINIYNALAMKDGEHFNTIDTRTAQAMINHIWCADGKAWSDRVWDNVELLKERLNDSLIECVVTGKNPEYLKQLLAGEFGVSYSRASSLVRTEMSHIQTQAAQQRYIDSGVQLVEVWADYDERRCDVCGNLHEKKFPINGKMPIPAHPNCRCCILPVVV